MKEIHQKTVRWLLSISASLLMLSASPALKSADSWKLAHSDQGFILHYSIVECDGVSTILLKARNETKAPIMAELSAKILGAGQDQAFVVGKVNPLVIAIPAGQTLTGECYSTNPNLRVNMMEHVPTHKFVATAFEINSITLK